MRGIGSIAANGGRGLHMATRRHFQTRVNGITRVPAYAGLLPELERIRQAHARKYGVSPAWVSAIAHAEYFGVEVPEGCDYREQPWREKRKRR